MRDLTAVIDRLLQTIPMEETELRNGLNKLRTSALYAAPETQLLWWNEVADFLTTEIGQPQEDWQERVANIFADLEP